MEGTFSVKSCYLKLEKLGMGEDVGVWMKRGFLNIFGRAKLL